MSLVIMMRERHLVNTDPQRRCYWGVNAKEELQWQPWEVLEYTKAEHSEERLKFWRNLNDYAVSQRGKGARTEFKVVEATDC